MRLTTDNRCKRKVPYLTKKMAIKALNILRRRNRLNYGDRGLKPYLCNCCSHYHLGNAILKEDKLNKLFDSINGD